MHYPDTVSIVKITIDNYKNETKAAAYSSKAYIEEESEIKYRNDGMPIDPIIHIMLPPSGANKTIKEGDYITITKLHGETPTSQEDNEQRIKKIVPVGSYSVHHMEVTT